jgi:hypothetical protein
MRSIFVQWSLLERERDRPLRDLSQWTTIDTIELSHVDLVWGPGDPRTDAAPLALPGGGALADEGVPALEEDRFVRLCNLLPVVQEHGFSVACNLSPLFFSSPELGDLSCLDVTGARVPGLHPRLPVYGCPANAEVVRLGEAMARAFVESWRPLDAVGLNHLEYTVWPQASVRELFTCFCDVCCARADAAGIDVERIRVELRALYEWRAPPAVADAAPLSAASMLSFLIERPELVHWLRLRRDAVSAYAERVVSALRDAARARGDRLRVGLEFQLPALAPLVGTDFRRLAPLFDWMTPKFPDYLPGSVVPVIADELASAAAAEPAPLRQRLRDLLELGEEPRELSPVADPVEGLLYAGAFRPEVIGRQRAYVEGRVAAKPIYPYLWLYGGDLTALAAKLAAVAAAGWNGFSLWCWDSDLTSEALRAAHGTL